MLRLAFAQDNIYIHAGCPASGRLGTLHAFNVNNSEWKSLAAAPEPGRGGTSLAATTVGGTDVLLRFGGAFWLRTFNARLPRSRD